MNTTLDDEINAIILNDKKLGNQLVSSEHSYPMDPFLWLASDKMDAMVYEIATQITTTVKERRRELDSSTHEKLLLILKIIILNFLFLHKDGQGLLLAVQKPSGYYTPAGKRFKHPLLSYRAFRMAYDGLVKLGFMQVHTNGYFDHKKQKGKTTRVEPRHRLLEKLDEIFPEKFVFFTRSQFEEVIELRDEKKKSMNYKDTPILEQERNNIQLINKCLNNHWYDLDIPDSEYEDIYKKMTEERMGEFEVDDGFVPMVDFNNRSLRRIYNNGSWKPENTNFQEGGRFYGGWWQRIPSEYRKYITIDSKLTVEVDFSNLHPAMIYAQQGKILSEDAYVIDGISRSNDVRKIIKVAFNKLINGKNRFEKPLGYQDDVVGATWKELLQRIETKHEVIKSYFRTGYGIKLQKIDSDIAEAVLLHFAKKDIPCLPIHDSFMVHHGHQEELVAVMSREYSIRMNGFINSLKIDNNLLFNISRYAEQNKQKPIDDVFVIDDPDKFLYPDIMNACDYRWHLWTLALN